MFSSQQMAGAQEAKLNQASTFKISASILSIDVPLGIISHGPTHSAGNVVLKYSLLALEGSVQSHDEGI